MGVRLQWRLHLGVPVLQFLESKFGPIQPEWPVFPNGCLGFVDKTAVGDDTAHVQKEGCGNIGAERLHAAGRSFR